MPQDRLLLGQERPVVTQLLREHQYGLFIFSNQTQDHWHFINVKYDAETEKRRLFRRISVSPEERLRTASERIAMINLQSIQPDMFGLQPLTIQSKHDEAFDVEAGTKDFYKAYETQFKELENELRDQTKDHAWAHDYSLQFLNRCMFIYFIQRKGWLGNNRDFLTSFWKSYQRSGQTQNSFVDNWLRVLFFEAFNNKFHGGHGYFPAEIREALSLAPYLNGGLFTESKLDQEHKAAIFDRRFEQIFRFLERYNFTIAEDSPLDKEVAVDPEMIGKVYEGLVNVSEEVDERGESGIFYTPRTEIDLMCRLSLVDHLANHLGDERKELLYQLIFALEPDEKIDADKAIAGANLWPTLSERLHDITVLDPACGSGSFLVGMLNILDDLQERTNRQLGITEASYDRKKRIIGQSLYGVDVMEWACHVAELRLWLALIIDADFSREELHIRQEPLLPHFSFKVRCGDSLVQEVGGINLGHIAASKEIPPSLKTRITNLKNEKLKFYNNDTTRKFHSVDALKNEEKRLFSDILDARVINIKDRIATLRRKLEGPQTYQIGLDGKGAPRPHQMDLEANQYRQEIEALNTEFVQTEASKKALSAVKEVPFVWDIAFVEIFEGENEGFDIVMGNPPYVRQEAIAAPVVHGVQVTDDKREYKAKLALSVYQAFPHFFGYKSSTSTAAHKIDAKSDLYIYFYLHGLSLLNSKGSFCFITSNSWLDVGYGADLQEFLLKHSHVKLVLDNQVRRTFANADVNSIIVLFSSPDDHHEWALDKTARFVMFRVPFEHILSPVIFDEIEEATERRVTKEYRVFPIQQSKLLEDGCEMPEEEETGKATGPLIKTTRYIGNKWGGKYLRAPDIYWTILEKGRGKLVRLGDIAEVRRGFTTGANEFFYLDDESIREWEIEEEFFKPLIWSMQQINKLHIMPEAADAQVFVCREPLSSLRDKPGALGYISYGSKLTTEKGAKRTVAGVRLPDAPTLRGRTLWYALPDVDPGQFVVPRLIRERFFLAGNPHRILISDMFFVGDFRNRKDAALGVPLLNSALTYLCVELFGRINVPGRINLYGPEIRSILLLNPASVSSSDTNLLVKSFDSLCERNILPIEEELQQEDRIKFDATALSAFGLGELQEQIYRALLEHVSERLEKEQTLKRQSKASIV